MNNRELKTIIKLFEDSNLASMKLEKDDVKIELQKPLGQAEYGTLNPHSNVKGVQDNAVEPAKHSEPLENESSNTTKVTAPLVGTYYESPAPDQPPFVRQGQAVKKGDPLCIIEAMKVMNEISAPQDGLVKSLHVENGDMVMFDQLILEIE